MCHLDGCMVEHLLPGIVELPLAGVVQESNLCQADRLLRRRVNTYTAQYGYNCPGIEPLPS